MASILDIAFFISPVLSIIWVVIENRKLQKGQTSDEPFPIVGKIGAGVLCALFPILNGAIFYYSLHKKFPKKARYANLVSIIVFCIEVAALLCLIYL